MRGLSYVLCIAMKVYETLCILSAALGIDFDIRDGFMVLSQKMATLMNFKVLMMTVWEETS